MWQAVIKSWRLYLLLSILFIVLLFLVYRICFGFPVPGFDEQKLQQLMSSAQKDQSYKSDANSADQQVVTKIPLTISAKTGFMTFKAHLNGEEILMVVDTAANETTFDMHLIDKLQLKPKDSNGVSKRAAGSLPLKIAHVKEFRVGSLSYYFDATFVDLTAPNEGRMTLGEPAIDGLLGMDLLLKWQAVIDCNERTLIIRSR